VIVAIERKGNTDFLGLKLGWIMCSSCFAWTEMGAAPVFVEQNIKKGEGVSKCIVFERGGSEVLKESKFLLFLDDGERIDYNTRRGDVVSM